MNIVFFGSSEFGIPSLRVISTTEHQVSCVVTQPDKKQGRGLRYAGTPIKTAAQECGFGLYQPLYVNTAETKEFLKGFNPDLFVVIAYGQILSEQILNIPQIFSLNVHASLLPKYRGAAPINWAIINGEKNTGITIIKMVKEMDAGPIILQKIVEVKSDDTSTTLEETLAHLAAHLLLETLDSIGKKNYQLIPQEPDKVSFAPKLMKKDGLINWGKSALDIYNLIRGVLSWPTAFTYYKNRLLKIYKAKIKSTAPLPTRPSPGEIIKVAPEGIGVATGDGDLVIERLQLEGKRIMEVREFLAGNKINMGDRFG